MVVVEMAEIQNTDLIKHVIKTLLLITRRRASESISIILMDTILKTLGERYNFLKQVKLKTSVSYGDISSNAIFVETGVNAVDQNLVGKVVESIVRVICMDLKEKAGVFFIKEFKDRLGRNYVSHLKEVGVDLDLLQLEIDYERTQRIRRQTHVVGSDEKTEEKSILGYRWENVSTWKYEKNECLLYDKNGKLLDKLHMDQIVENHVRMLTEAEDVRESKQKSIDLGEEHFKLLKLLYTRDVDMEETKHYLNKTQPQIEYLVYELLDADLLQKISGEVVSITQKGVDYLLSHEEQKLEKETQVKKAILD
jgi:hypothetical protein